MRKVLIVEDEHSQAEVLSLLFRTEGFEVDVAVNGREALDKLKRGVPDLIVTDYMMPGMNGGEMAMLVRGIPSLAKVPIVMTSATNAHQVEKHSAHYDAFLGKPYLWDELFAVVAKLVK